MLKENAYQDVYPGEAFVAGRLDRVMSNLLKIIREFIIYDFSDLKEKAIPRQLVLAKYFRERKLKKNYHRSIDQMTKIQSQRQKNNLYLHDQFLIDREITMFETFYNQRKQFCHVPETLHSLALFYLVYRLEYFCWLINQHPYDVPLNLQSNLLRTDKVLAAFKEEVDLEEEPLLKIYDFAIQMIRGDGDQRELAYRELKALLTQYAQEIPFTTLKQFHTLCRNYCTKQYNNSQGDYLGELFDLYRQHLEEGTLFYEGGLMPSTMRNIVVYGLRMEAYDWLAQFLEAYRDRITGTNQKEETYQFNLANYHFSLQNYDQALTCLVDRYDDIYYQLAAKRLELKIYYEIDSEVLDSKIAAFKIYIYRISQKIVPATPREGNNNFIDLLKQMRRTKTRYNLTRIQKLIEKVNSKKTIAERDWLLEKLEGLTKL